MIGWWYRVGLNHRPRAYESHALTSWATVPCKSIILYFGWNGKGVGLVLFVKSDFAFGEEVAGAVDDSRSNGKCSNN